MKKTLRFLITSLKILGIGLIIIEVVAFCVITVSNYVVYGVIREGGRVRYDPYTLYLNVQGVRPTSHNPTLPDSTPPRRLWLFGGSTMRGATPHNDRTIPSYLAHLLNQGNPAVRVTVINYGEDSFNSLLETKYLQKALIDSPDPPQVIIFYDGANDCTYFNQYRTPEGHHGYRRVRALIESYYRSYWGLLKPVTAALYASFTKELFDKTKSLAVPLEPDSPLVQAFCEATVRRYDFVQRQAAAWGAQFFLVWQPLWWVERAEVSPEVQEQERRYLLSGKYAATFQHNIRMLYGVLAEKLGGKPYFVNFQNILCTRTEPVYQADGVHLKDAGRKMVAEHLGRILTERSPTFSPAPQRSSQEMRPPGAR